ncbi:hypothetical protein AGMMS49983_15920 [Clostridia bacterium]|nr:hypothetical protein AGMMS49983_15920 [Clostridia bacterium]
MSVNEKSNMQIMHIAKNATVGKVFLHTDKLSTCKERLQVNSLNNLSELPTGSKDDSRNSVVANFATTAVSNCSEFPNSSEGNR